MAQNNFSLEPAACLLVFAWSLISITLTNQLMYQSCVAVFGYNETQCAELNAKNESGDVEALETKIQPYIVNIQIVSSLLQISISAVFCLLLGSWSDRKGRKPVLYLAFIGSLTCFGLVLLIAILSTHFTISPWFYVLPFIPFAFTGGAATLNSVTFSYICDISSPEKRSVRGAIFQGVFMMSFLAGTTACGFLPKVMSNIGIFSVSLVCGTVALLWIRFFLRESLECLDEEGSDELLSTRPFRQIYRTATQERPDNERQVIWFGIAALSCLAFTTNGFDQVFYLFMREKFAWTTQNWTTYLTYSMVLCGLASLLCIYAAKKVFNSSDTVLSSVSIASNIVQNVIVAVANSSWLIYFASTVGFFRGAAYSTVRSIVVNVGPDADVGKVISLITAFESVSNFIAAWAYSALYKETITSFPGAISVLSAVGNSVGFILLLGIWYQQRQSTRPRYSTL